MAIRQMDENERCDLLSEKSLKDWLLPVEDEKWKELQKEKAMELNKDFPKPIKQDNAAPELLEIIIKNKKTGNVLLTESVGQKHFKTGSVGYYVGGKMTNPESGERYQMSCNITLIGSKPER